MMTNDVAKQQCDDARAPRGWLIIDDIEDAIRIARKQIDLLTIDDIVALASEEIAIRKVVDREIETYDPYEREVLVWHR